VANRRSADRRFHVTESLDPRAREPEALATGASEHSFRLIVDTLPGLIAVMTAHVLPMATSTSRVDRMLRITRVINSGTPTLLVSGRIGAEQLPELRRSVEGGAGARPGAPPERDASRGHGGRAVPSAL
jgi:hypothetical protein